MAVGKWECWRSMFRTDKDLKRLYNNAFKLLKMRIDRKNYMKMINTTFRAVYKSLNENKVKICIIIILMKINFILFQKVFLCLFTTLTIEFNKTLYLN